MFKFLKLSLFYLYIHVQNIDMKKLENINKGV